MDKVTGVANNLSGFFQDLVLFVEKVWKFIADWFGIDAAANNGETCLTNVALGE